MVVVRACTALRHVVAWIARRLTASVRRSAASSQRVSKRTPDAGQPVPRACVRISASVGESVASSRFMLIWADSRPVGFVGEYTLPRGGRDGQRRRTTSPSSASPPGP